MSRTCTICKHPEREAIDKALLDGESFRHIAARCNVTTGALQRHKAGHVPAALALAQDATEAARADDLLAQVQSLQRKALIILDKAERAGDLRTAVSAIREARGNIELLARLLGELQEQAPTVNVLVASQEWLTLRATILQALDGYPDARLAVVRALGNE